jgi:predicted DNA-binding transcriptional regulator AlpA
MTQAIQEDKITLGRFLLGKEVCERLRIHQVTLWNMHRAKKGPPRVRLNGRTYGYPENLLEQWLLSRLEKPLPRETTAQ